MQFFWKISIQIHAFSEFLQLSRICWISLMAGSLRDGSWREKEIANVRLGWDRPEMSSSIMPVVSEMAFLIASSSSRTNPYRPRIFSAQSGGILLFPASTKKRYPREILSFSAIPWAVSPCAARRSFKKCPNGVAILTTSLPANASIAHLHPTVNNFVYSPGRNFAPAIGIFYYMQDSLKISNLLKKIF